VVLRAEILTDDGERVSDRVVLVADAPGNLPSEAALLADVDGLAARLTRVKSGSRLKEYSGPVLFDGVAAPQLFHALLGRGVAAQPGDAGGGRRRMSEGESLDKLLGKRVLPASFRVFDDPTTVKHNGVFLAGNYEFDDEGVKPIRVDLVQGGKFVGFVSSRTPTAQTTASNGHGRGGRAAIGNLFVEASDGVDDGALRKKLLETAKEQGLTHALRVNSFSAVNPGAGLAALLRGGRGGRGGGQGAAGARGASGLPDPLVVTKIFVEDGREEPLRALELDGVNIASLKEILAAGSTHAVWNTGGGAAAASVIAPAVILETVSVYGVEATAERKPVLPAPSAR
jgi:hypothetical protein